MSGTLTVEPESVAMAFGTGRGCAPLIFGNSGKGAASAGCRGFTACAGCSAGVGACAGEGAGATAGVDGGCTGACGVTGAGGGVAGFTGAGVGVGAGVGTCGTGFGDVAAEALRGLTGFRELTGAFRRCSGVRAAVGRASGMSAGASVTTSIGAVFNSCLVGGRKVGVSGFSSSNPPSRAACSSTVAVTETAWSRRS